MLRDTISAASYYGFTFREHLMMNPEALAAAEKLAASIEARPALMDLIGGK
jgi:hypothetical protein